MTVQASDLVRWHSREFLLAGIKGTGLFAPRDVGLRPEIASTACYRGYLCSYSVAADILYLEELTVSLDGAPPPLWGVAPSEDKILQGDFRFSGLHHRCPVTGALLLVADVASAWMRGVTPNPVAFASVFELVLENGAVVDSIDHSGKMPALRAQARALVAAFADEWTREQYRSFTALSWAVAPGFEPLPAIRDPEDEAS